MKKILPLLLVLILFASIICGCAAENNEALELKCEQLRAEIVDLEARKASIEAEIVDSKIENGLAKYIVGLEIKQSHFTLDLGEHLKDSMNAITIEIPVDKEYYDSLSVGDTISDHFRVGSLIMKGSFGNWDVTVKYKEIK